MPTEDRIKGVAYELSETLNELGYKVEEFVGPNPAESHEGMTDENPDPVVYYIIVRAGEIGFYISFHTHTKYGSIIFPLDVVHRLSRYLDQGEVEGILDKEISWRDIDEEGQEELFDQAVLEVLENTDASEYYLAGFNLSAYASTATVKYRHETTEDGFPRNIQCTRGIFPYTENMTLSRVDNRVDSVVIAGERAKRYVEYSLRINKDFEDPKDYELVAIL